MELERLHVAEKNGQKRKKIHFYFFSCRLPFWCENDGCDIRRRRDRHIKMAHIDLRYSYIFCGEILRLMFSLLKSVSSIFVIGRYSFLENFRFCILAIWKRASNAILLLVAQLIEIEGKRYANRLWMDLSKSIQFELSHVFASPHQDVTPYSDFVKTHLCSKNWHSGNEGTTIHKVIGK